MSSDNRDGSTIRFLFHLINQTLLHRWLYCNMRWTLEILSFSRYFAVACHKLSHFNLRVFTFDFTWNCCRLLEAKFSRNLGQFKWVTRETRYHVSIADLLKRNLMSQVAELLRRPRTMLKILYFSGDQKYFQKSPRINFLYDRSKKRFHSLAWET